MKLETILIDNIQIAEVKSDDLIITSVSEGVDLLGNLYYQGFSHVLLYEKNITPEFFDLTTGMAGEILQKFSNYAVRLSIAGNFNQYPGESLKAFIRECNKSGHISFVSSREKAIHILSNI